MDLLRSSRVCGVESGWMSVESGKLKSPVMSVVQTRCGGKCLLIARSAACTRRGGH